MCNMREKMLDPTRVSCNQLQVQLKARMLKSRVINEGAQMGLYMYGGGCGWKGHQREVSTGVYRLWSQSGACVC